MEFSRIGEHTIKCVISEEEIYDLGYTMDEIMSNGERTQEFMNQIFDMASEEFELILIRNQDCESRFFGWTHTFSDIF